MMIRTFSRSGARPYACAHAHEEGQLVVLLEGRCHLHVGEADWLLRAGMASWIPPQVPHAVEARAEVVGISLFTDHATGKGREPSPRLFVADRFLRDLVVRAASVAMDPQRLANLAAVIEDEIQAPRHPGIAVPMPRTASLAGLCRMVLLEPSRFRTVDDVCAEIGWSRRTFERRFSEETGMSFGRWRTRARLLQAASDLATGKTVTEAAFNAGFDSMSAFGSAFQGVTGELPSEFRRRLLA